MKCPLLFKVVFQELPNVNVVNSDCLKEECAWWDDGDECCMVFEIGAKLCSMAMGISLILKEVQKGGEIGVNLQNG